MLKDGEWCEDGGGQTLQLGTIFRGRIYQRGGGSIYAKCWIGGLERAADYKDPVGEPREGVDRASDMRGAS
jgi:hypothetical protein